jgi:hypothetical protein
MSHQHFCEAAGHWFECDGKALRHGDTEPSVCVCDTCGLPLEQGDHSRCENLVELLACPAHRDGERGRTLAAEMEQAVARQEAAYAEFMKTTEGTPQYHQALEDFMLLLFPDCNSSITLLPQAHSLDAQPDTARHGRTPGRPKERDRSRMNAPTPKPGDHCPFCGEGTLVPSPSGINLLCHACNRITVLPQAHRPDRRPDAPGHWWTRGRHKKRF